MAGSGFGDLNGDIVVDMFDIDPSVPALTEPAAYAEAYPDGERELADCNGDGFIDFFDVEASAGLLGM